MATRPLTKLEQQFVKEAEDGFFRVGYEDNGSPYALGASGTDNLFSMPVNETPEIGGESCYVLLAP